MLLVSDLLVKSKKQMTPLTREVIERLIKNNRDLEKQVMEILETALALYAVVDLASSISPVLSCSGPDKGPCDFCDLNEALEQFQNDGES